MAIPIEKYRLYLSGPEIYALLELTDPANLDESEITQPLQTARVTLRKKMIELEEGTIKGGLVIIGAKESKYSTSNLFPEQQTSANKNNNSNPVQVNLDAGFDQPMVTGNIKQLPGESITDTFARTGLWAQLEKASEEAKRKKEAGETLQDQFTNPRFQIKD